MPRLGLKHRVAPSVPYSPSSFRTWDPVKGWARLKDQCSVLGPNSSRVVGNSLI